MRLYINSVCVFNNYGPTQLVSQEISEPNSNSYVGQLPPLHEVIFLLS